MKNFKFMFVALVAMLGFTACDNDPEHIYDDHSADLVGTWTCMQEDANFAEALVIKADGSILSTGYDGEDFWENVAGKMVVENGNVTLTFEDGDNFKGHFDIIPGKAFSIYNEDDVRFTFNYCENDLSDEIVGMWVATTGLYMSVEVFNEDGSAIYTGFVPESEEIAVTSVTSYKVVGDLQFHTVAEDNSTYVVHRLIYSPSSQTQLGEIMTWQVDENISFPRLRIKQSLNLTNKNYDYSNIYVTNVKGKDTPFEFAGQTLNFSTLDGSVMDKLMKHILFNLSFDAEKIHYNCYFNGENKSIDAPIVVEGNKVTIKMSENNSVYRDIEVYMFQDQDNTQMHMYMPVKSFEKFFGNVTAVVLAKNGELNLEDTNAVAQHYAKIEAAIETINLSFIFKVAK